MRQLVVEYCWVKILVDIFGEFSSSSASTFTSHSVPQCLTPCACDITSQPIKIFQSKAFPSPCQAAVLIYFPTIFWILEWSCDEHDIPSFDSLIYLGIHLKSSWSESNCLLNCTSTSSVLYKVPDTHRKLQTKKDPAITAIDLLYLPTQQTNPPPNPLHPSWPWPCPLPTSWPLPPSVSLYIYIYLSAVFTSSTTYGTVRYGIDSR